jgi:non-ribosomal peptide synthetase component E (peptide arylation enzyme)
MLKEIKPDLPDLRFIIFAGDNLPSDNLTFKELTRKGSLCSDRKGLVKSMKYKPWEVTRIVTTSGTTGIPKCCEWPTVALMQAGRCLLKRWELKPDDVIGAFYNIIGAGLSYLSLYSVPMVGAKVVLMEHFVPQGFCELVQKEKITIAGIVPAEVARLLEYPELDRYNLSSLRLLAHGTTVLPHELAVRAEKRLGCKFVQTYGAMDAGPLCSSSITDSQDIRLNTVGRPYDGNEIKILSTDGQQLPKGQLGDVVVRGPTCISGYYDNPDLNARTWKDGWFDTNNEGYFRPDGNLVLMGRRRDVIIRGGQNIYPKEVEDLLLQHQKLSEVAIVRMPDREMGEKACAYVVPRRGQTFTFDEMISFLKSKRIAPFKMPERLEVIAELPLAPAGNKVDVIKLENDIIRKLADEARKPNINPA